MDYLKGKVLLITGASGIAAATVKLAVAAGAQVYYAGLEEQECLRLRKAVGASEQTDFRVCDLTEADNASALISACVDRFGQLDALFNVAGTSGRKFGDGPLETCTEAGWSETLRANLDIQYRMCREAIGAMMQSSADAYGQRGVILNMASVLGLFPEPLHFSAVAYATAKGAIVTMTRHIAAFYASSGIRVNAIAPGLTATKMSARATGSAEILAFIKEKQPLIKDVIQAEDVASVALFLLSSSSRIITGQTIVADAGWSIS